MAVLSPIWRPRGLVLSSFAESEIRQLAADIHPPHLIQIKPPECGEQPVKAAARHPNGAGRGDGRTRYRRVAGTGSLIGHAATTPTASKASSAA